MLFSVNDADMLLGRVCGIVVGNHDEDLESLRDADRVYFAEASHADGNLEGFRHCHDRSENVGAGVGGEIGPSIPRLHSASA